MFVILTGVGIRTNVSKIMFGGWYAGKEEDDRKDERTGREEINNETMKDILCPLILNDKVVFIVKKNTLLTKMSFPHQDVPCPQTLESGRFLRTSVSIV